MLESNVLENQYSLTSMQKSMLFHSIYFPEVGVYVQQQVCTLSEAVDVHVLQQAWQQLMHHHAVLRASFIWDDGDEPLQIVLAQPELPWQFLDWQTSSEAETAVNLNALLEADRQQGFTDDNVPFMRVTLIQHAAASFTMLWTYHHALIDGRSRIILLEDLFALYDALRDGRSIAFAERLPFQAFVAWQETQDWSAHQAYWQAALKGFSSPTPLLYDSPPLIPGQTAAQTAVLSDTLSAAATQNLHDLVAEHDITMNTIVQATWALLLSRYSGEKDVVFGTTRACRYSSLAGAKDTVGLLMNTLPLRVQIDPQMPMLDLLNQVRQQWVAMRDYEQAPIASVQEWSDLPRNVPLFDSNLTFEKYRVGDILHSKGGNWAKRRFQLKQRTNFSLELRAHDGEQLQLNLHYDPARFDADTIIRMMGHLQTILQSIASNSAAIIADMPMLTSMERKQLLLTWNDTDTFYPKDKCMHHLIEAQAAKTPHDIAIVFADKQITYAELNGRSNQLARHLQKLGIGPDLFVGVYTERSIDMMVALLAIHKAGGAYLPLDPAFPAERLAFMIADANAPVIITQGKLLNQLPSHQAQTICIDIDWITIGQEPAHNIYSKVTPENLSYIIYTSGSTGKPKGVMVRHRNVVNFFAGMDERIPRHVRPQQQDSWLAVTSLSFDISVLELFWTLAHGFKVVLFGDRVGNEALAPPPSPAIQKKLDFSLFYFASEADEAGVADKYRLLLEGAKYADQHGFTAVWTPERHFHQFGGLYPNPSIASAAIATITQNVQLRAGSCVLPLHSPIRVAEEWALVDNLSNGRVGIAFASGWQPNDFVLMPQNYSERKQIMFDNIEIVQRLWRGEIVSLPGPAETNVDVQTLPRPIQSELPIWITAAGNPETFRMAGAKGFHLLTHLLGQTTTQLSEKLAIYRQAWREAGHPGQGHVTIMLHTFVGEDDDVVREIVRQPMKDYLRSAVGLIKQAAADVPRLKEKAAMSGRSPLQLFEAGELTDEDMEALLDHAFERYFVTSGLFGTPQTCMKMINRLKEIDVDEVACLVDFGVPSETVLSHLTRLNQVRELAEPRAQNDYSLPAQIARHHVSHLQCTPSMATIFTTEETHRQALRQIEVMMVGGEALPLALADDLRTLVAGDVLNMYGPTETTIWSSTELVREDPSAISIGRPITNTQLYILDEALHPVPIGVVGELYIGGDGVVRGYHNRPELNRERFIPNPFVADEDARLYKTGDLARYRADGRIDFLGRSDFQVKVRGYRIELGEIEALLDTETAVKQAVVIVREDVPGDKRLVAYLITETGQEIEISGLRHSLRAKLPEYMIPAHFVCLDAFPLTPNAKIDRKSLPEPSAVQNRTRQAPMAPENSIEEQLQTIWRDMLHVDVVGMEDNLFDLGGHSILVVQMVRRMQAEMNIKISIADMFRFPTIRSLSSHLNAETPVDELVLSGTDRAQTRKEAMQKRRRRRRARA